MPHHGRRAVGRGRVLLAAFVGGLGLVAMPPLESTAEASWDPVDIVAWPRSGGLEVTFTLPAGFPNENHSLIIDGSSNGDWVTTCSGGSTCTITATPDAYDQDAALSSSVRIFGTTNGSSNAYLVRNVRPQYPTPTLSVHSATPVAFQVSASGVSGATKFCFRVETDPDRSGDGCSAASGGLGYLTSSNHTFTGREVDQLHYVWLRVGGDDGRAFSEWTEPVSIRTTKPSPSLNRSAREYAVELTWGAYTAVTPTDNLYRYRADGTSTWTVVSGQPTSVGDDELVVEGLINGVEYEFQRGIVYGGVTYWGSTRTATPSKLLYASNFSLAGTTKVYDGTTTLDSSLIRFDVTEFIDADGDLVLGDDGAPLVVSFAGLAEDGSSILLDPDGDPAPVDDVRFDLRAVFDDPAVGTGKDVVISLPSALSEGPVAGKYATSNTDDTTEALRTVTADITARPLTLSDFRVEVTDGEEDDARVYDGTTVVADEQFTDDRVVGDALEFSYTLGELPDKHVGTDKPVTFTDIAISGGADAANYDLQTTSGTALVDVTERPLTLSSFAVDDKVYDATTGVVNDATTDDPDGEIVIPGGSTFEDDRIAGDELEFSYDVAFADTEVGTDIAVGFSSIAISGGPDLANYSLQTTSGSTTADIDPRPVHLGGSRVYDATRLVDVADLALVDRDGAGTGLVGDQTLVLEGAGSIAAKDAGTGLVIETGQQETDPGLGEGGDGPTEGFEAVEGAVGISLADGDGGGLATNYSLTGGTHLFDVTPKPMSVTGLTAAQRIYDGATAVTLSGGTLVGTVTGDSVSLQGATTGTAAAPTVGTHAVAVGATLGGTDAANYALTQPSVTVTFTTRTVTLEGLRVVTRPYDGGRTARLTGGTLVNVAPAGAGVTVTGTTVGTYAAPDAGTHTVVLSLGLSGPDAANYTLAPVNLSGSIVPAPASLSFLGGMTQLLASAGLPAVGTSPPGLDGVQVRWVDGAGPTGPGSYVVIASLANRNYRAEPITGSVTVLEDPEDERVEGVPVFGPIGVRGDGTGDGTGPTGPLPDLGPGESLLLVDGVPVDGRVEVGPDPDDPDGPDGLTVAAGGARAWFATRTEGGDDVPLGPDAELLVTPGGFLTVVGAGFAPGTAAEVWIFSDPRFLGTVPVDADGRFTGRFPVAPDLELGVHTAQLSGAVRDGSVLSVNLGLRVLAPDDPALGPAATGGDPGAATGTDDGRERVEVVSASGSGALGEWWVVLGLLVLGLGGWFLLLARRRDEDEEADTVEVGAGPMDVR